MLYLHNEDVGMYEYYVSKRTVKPKLHITSKYVIEPRLRSTVRSPSEAPKEYLVL